MPGEDFIQEAMMTLNRAEVRVPCANTIVTAGANSAVQALAATIGFAAGDKIFFETASVERTILSVDSSTQVTLTASVNSTTNEVVNHNRYVDLDTCGIIALDNGQGCNLYLNLPADPATLYGRAWLILDKTGTDPYSIQFADGSTAMNDGMLSIDVTDAYTGTLLLSEYGTFIAWKLTAWVP